MNKILYPHIGNAAQYGIYLALSDKKNLKEAILESQLLFKYSTKKIIKKDILSINEQLSSIIKRGYYELRNLGELAGYQRSREIKDLSCKFLKDNIWIVKINSKRKKTIRFDYEFKKDNKNTLVELKVVWSNPEKISSCIKKQVISYSKNYRQNCKILYLSVKKEGKKLNFINTYPYWFKINTKKP